MTPPRLPSFVTLVSLSAATVLSGAQPAKAILNYYIYESGGNVVMETLGSLNLPNPITTSSTPCTSSPGGRIKTVSGSFCTGVGGSILSKQFQVTGPGNIAGIAGTVEIGPADSTSGISTQLFGLPGVFLISSSYVSGPIVSSATYNSETFTSLGFTTTGPIGTWTLSGTGDTINMEIGPPPAAAVPGPLPLFGAAAAFGYSRRLRRRVSQSHVAPKLSNSIGA